MPERAVIEVLLAQCHLAFVGASRDPKQFANAVYRQLRQGGRVLYPDSGTPVVDGACPFMFEEPVHGIHMLHRLLAGRRFAA
jgi:hypothetical protein